MRSIELKHDSNAIREEWSNFIKYNITPKTVDHAVIRSWQRCKDWKIDPFNAKCHKTLSTSEFQNNCTAIKT